MAVLVGYLIGGVAAALLLFLFDPARFPIYPVCPFHQLTGLECPGCGSLRALHQLLHGHLVAAFRFNAFVVLSLPVGVWLAARVVARKMRAEPAAPPRPVWLWGFLAAYLAFGILRNLPVPFFAAFAP